MTRRMTSDEMKRKAARQSGQAHRHSHPQPGGLGADAARLHQLIGNRGAGRLLSSAGGYSLLQRQPRSGSLPTPADLAETALSGGPGSKTADWQRAGRLLKNPSPSQRVTVDTPFKYRGLKLVEGEEFQKAFQKAVNAGRARPEARLPEAFLAVESNISPPFVEHQSERTMKSNVVVDTKETKGGGQMWVSEASLTWTVVTGAFLDISRIDPRMLTPTRSHEQGHKTIAERILADLSKRLKAELEQSLPTEQNPLKKAGKSWFQDGLDAVIRQIERLNDRYLDWWDELAEKADSAWDAQEAKTLSSIAAARIQGHRQTAPADEDDE